MSKLNNSIQGGCAGARQEAGISQQRYLRILVNILDIRYHIVSSPRPNYLSTVLRATVLPHTARVLP